MEQSTPSQQPETLSTAEDAQLLKQQIKTARIFLFVVAVSTFLSGVLFIFLPKSDHSSWVDGVFIFLLAGVYSLLAIWTKKKPYTAMRVGLAITVAVILLPSVIRPSAFFDRWPSKLLSIAMLCWGLADSKDAQKKMG
jgi:hypothetical protein